ncbi:MAG: hypothetical protein HYS61_07845 [Acidobacteria bacterium]|nr:hypothetical protein [Acidobacteriota bacterium]MBI3068658.1 hypothetical protein [Betaproteobacteria bacterium]
MASRKSTKVSRPVAASDKESTSLVAENENLRAEIATLKNQNRQSEALAEAYRRFADNGLRILNVIKDEITATVSRNEPVIVALKKMIGDHHRSRANLAKGREKGAAHNKSRAQLARDEWRQMAADLHRNQSTRDWTLDQQAQYIQQRSRSKTKSGKPYAVGTIRNAIKGVQ